MRSLLLIVLLSFAANGRSQSATDSLFRLDSLRRTDSIAVRDSLLRLEALQADSLAAVAPPVRDTLRPVLRYAFTSDSFLYRPRLFFSFTNPVRYTVSEKGWTGKEAAFYAVVLLLLLFAVLKNAFPRYLSDLYSAYFRTTVRQRQVQEQLLQSPLPSLFFNVFFVLSGGVFAALLVQRFGYGGKLPFALLAVYAAAALSVIYAGKFLLLKFLGWVFQVTDVVSAYLFVVFSTNKVLGIFLLPFTVLLAFTTGTANLTAFTVSAVVVLVLFGYRFFLGLAAVGGQVRSHAFHFLLYLAAFEVLPLLLINKLLLTFLQKIV